MSDSSWTSTTKVLKRKDNKKITPIKLTNVEKETIINFNEAERTASVYTCNGALKRQLSDLCRTRPEQVRQTADNGRGGLTFELPKKWLKVSPPRVLTSAQRAVLDRMNKNRRSAAD